MHFGPVECGDIIWTSARSRCCRIQNDAKTEDENAFRSSGMRRHYLDERAHGLRCQKPREFINGVSEDELLKPP